MNMPIKISLWDKEVAVLSWNNEKEYGIIEFLESFIRKGLNVAPLMMPLEDLVRGES